ncbi:glutamate transport system substrate-binding protein [Amycolatopsis arida]|uniref:Glutamate transport system substrate-binding protein n=1 Tax=Amycolatopsis arida TaxID=587909 RepID=A0A1I5M7Q4_9PSEU|nr:glutamate ABC transporter substrate-binding protein [Amycolatopsis arida]TDX93985.1 glutamate transport system substrate-binding protein [Amycolatopsis arida]SFP05041.1 glutamate transport system substrate-binding protein [Amycolatopsis arida]
MRLARTALAVLLCGASVACSASGAAPDSVVTRAEEHGTLTIGIRFDQPGLSERTVDGRFLGFDVDVATHVAAQLGVDAEDITWRETTPSRRETDITSGAVDLVVATYSITDRRKQQVAFAGPYFSTGQDLLVRLSTTGITGPESLNGRKLCAVPNSTSALQVKERFAQAVRLVEYPRYPDCVTALLAGQVDAVTTDGVILAGYAAQHPELLRVVGQPFSVERYGIGLRKGDTDGQAAINDAIRKMISSGAWRESLERNIGPSGYPLPAPPEVSER